MKTLVEYQRAMEWFRLSVEERNAVRAQLHAGAKLARIAKNEKKAKKLDEQAQTLLVEMNFIGIALSALDLTVQDWDEINDKDEKAKKRKERK